MLRCLSHKVVSGIVAKVLLLALIFNVFVYPIEAFALTSGPTQPEYSSFNSASSSEMVNLFTGDFNYNIPLMDVGGYPINISYSGSPGMEQEASWVGLGWSINSGAINRNMRGIPDDFNGEEIKREINIEDFKSWGVGAGGGAEIAGLAATSLSGGLGVTKSNYKGIGIEFYFEPTLSVNAGSKVQGGLTAGLGVKASTTDGMDIYPQLGVSGQYSSNKKTASIGLNIGASINSRDGLKALNFGVSASGGETRDSKKSNGRYNNGGIGMGVGTSASIPASSQGFLPQLMSDMRSQSYSLDFKLGPNLCIVAPFGYVKGYYAQNGLASSDVTLKAYGYLNSGGGDRQALHDFSREKDGMMYPETPNLPLTNYSYDMFYASAQGMEMAFRPQRNDFGMVHDNPTDESSFGVGLGGEVLVTPDVNFGINVNTFWSNGHYGRWDENNDMLNKLGFTNHGGDYEASYFKVAGEKTPDETVFLNAVQNEHPVKVKLDKISNTKWKATSQFMNANGVTTTIGASVLKKNARAIRNNLVSYLKADDACYAAIEKSLNNFSPLSPASFSSANFDNIIVNTSGNGIKGELKSTALTGTINRLSHAAGKVDHLSELIITNPSGTRYVYGLPVYNRVQREVTFNVSGNAANQSHATVTHGLIGYSATDASKGNNKGLDHFYEKNNVPDYAHSYLLTALLSSDYVDRTGDGPSADDYGDYTRFNYSRVSDYNWRMPFENMKAAFNQGLATDVVDDKGSYVYGEREAWYPHSVETKNFIAFFVLNDIGTEPRLDARSAAGESGGMGAIQSRFLKQIRLYAKKDLMNGIANAKPVKIVHFEYNYALCPGVPNHANTATPGVPVIDNTTNLPKNGKLTLAKVYFTYGQSMKGSLTPYHFTYCNGSYVSSLANPSYDPSSINKWGVYQKNNGGSYNTMDFPYATQDKSAADVNAMAWSLTEVKTPAGSKINVTYESDDYAFVQNKEAGQMFKLLGVSASLSGAPTNDLYGNKPYLFVDLSESKDKGVLLGTANAAQAIKDKYVKDIKDLYIKANVDLRNGKYERVPLYGEIEDVYVSNTSVYTFGSNTYYNAVIKLKQVGVNDDGSSFNIHPIVKAAFQLGRMYLPGIVFPGSNTAGTNETIIKGMVTLIQDARFMFSGINKALYNRNIAKTFDPATSLTRLYHPFGKKLGGGARVKKIEITDDWNAMSGETSSVYGQEYSYTTFVNGQEISSGVASYEPLNGGDENSLRRPVKFAVKRIMAPNDEYFQEEPIGEMFYPDAMVGYSKITVKNLDRSAQNVKKHATGKTEYEFYTAKDFPVTASRTPLEKQRVKPSLLRSLLNFGSTDKLYMSQGYVIKTNDMHGKPKGNKQYAEDALTPYAGITYYYKTKPGLGNQLDNSVSVISASNVISTKVIGQTTDVISDSRFAETNMWGAGVAVNVNLAACTIYVPLVFVWPSFSHEKREFSSMSTTKLINQYGLIDYAEAFENNSLVRTHNVLYDEQTGDVVLTRTMNNFNDPVYNLNYPAYWAYPQMAGGYKNVGITIGATGHYNASSAQLSGTYFIQGDEVLVKELQGTNPVVYTKTWVSKDVSGGGSLYLIKEDGTKFTTATPLSDIFLQITRSGNRNLQDLSMAGVSSLQSPVTGTKIDVTTSTKVLSASAVEYSDNWQTMLGDMVNNSASCNCTPNATFASDETAFFNYLLSNPAYAAIKSGTTWSNNTYPLWVSGSGYVATVFQNFLSHIGGVSNYVSANPPAPIQIQVSKTSDFTTSPGFRKDILEFKLLPINICSTGNPSESPSVTSIVYQMKLEIVQNLSSYTGSNSWNYVTSLGNYSLITPCSNPCSVGSRLSSAYVPVGNVFCGNFSSSGSAPSGMNLSYSGYDLSSGGTNYNAIYMNSSPTFLCYYRANCTQTPASSVQCGKMVGDIINPYRENLRGNWRPKYDYSYLSARNSGGNIRIDGNFTAYTGFYQNGGNANWQNLYTPGGSWVRNTTLQLMNPYGNALQSTNALDLPSASLNGYNHSMPVAVASNAYYNEIAFDGFEDYEYLYNECSAYSSSNTSGYLEHFNFYNYKPSVISVVAHTGKYALLVGSGATGSAVVKRKLSNFSPTGAADNVPYTLKAKDNTGLFGPYYNAGVVKTFVASVWTRENTNGFAVIAPQVSTYTSPDMIIKLGTTIISGSIKKSPVVNGWQKLECEFTIPASVSPSTDISIELKNAGAAPICLFDDIRIHPLNASMKTMVYDPHSLRLMAELDDRNFATLYEYDEEGTLVRVKKETEKGIYTIKETRSGLRK